MKKALVAILAFIYINTTIGITIHKHYCMGKLVDTGFWHSEADHCTTCGMHKDNSEKEGCCSDKHEQVKMQGDQKLAAIHEFQALHFLDASIIPDHFQNPEPLAFKHSIAQPTSNSPPRSQVQPFYLLNRNFRI